MNCLFAVFALKCIAPYNYNKKYIAIIMSVFG